MRKLLTGLVVLGTLGIAGTSHALNGNGTVAMGWDACNTSPTTDKVVAAGQVATANLVTFVTGQSDSTIAYELRILYGDATKHVPDAWRFDASGCETSAFVIVNAQSPAALSKTCPSFQNAGGAHAGLSITDVSFYPAGHQYASTLMAITVANSYPAGNLPANGSKYFLMDAEFNLSASSVGPTPGDNSTCGGLENEICFNLAQADWLATDGSTQTDWLFHGGASGDWVTAGTSPFAGSCQGTPAQTVTWGRVKGQYRN